MQVFGRKTDGTLWACGHAKARALVQMLINIKYSSPVQVGALTTWTQTIFGSYSDYSGALQLKPTALLGYGENNAMEI